MVWLDGDLDRIFYTVYSTRYSMARYGCNVEPLWQARCAAAVLQLPRDRLVPALLQGEVLEYYPPPAVCTTGAGEFPLPAVLRVPQYTADMTVSNAASAHASAAATRATRDVAMGLPMQRVAYLHCQMIHRTSQCCRRCPAGTERLVGL